MVFWLRPRHADGSLSATSLTLVAAPPLPLCCSAAAAADASVVVAQADDSALVESAQAMRKLRCGAGGFWNSRPAVLLSTG